MPLAVRALIFGFARCRHFEAFDDLRYYQFPSATPLERFYFRNAANFPDKAAIN